MNVENIEKHIWVSNDRTLIENYYTLVYFKQLIKDERYYINDSNNLSKYYIPIMKGMLNRCIREDQKDWKFIYLSFGFTDKKIYIQSLVKEIEKMECNLNYYKIADDKFEYIKEKQEKCINRLLKRNFVQLIQNALSSILEKIYERNLEEHIKMSLAEFINSEFAIKVKFDRIDYRLVFGGIENIEDGIYIKDRLDEVTPGTKRKFYKRLIQVATTNDELNIIRKNILEEGISINIPNSIDEKNIKKCRKLICSIDNNFEDYNSFEEAWDNRKAFMDSDDDIKLKYIGYILLKVKNIQQLNLLKDEIEYYKIKGKRGSNYHKLLYNIKNCESLNTAIEIKDMMYREGILVDLKVYNSIIEKFKDTNDISEVIKEMNLLMRDEIDYNNFIESMKSAESFDECINLKNTAYEKGISIDENVYGIMLYMANNIEQVNLVMDEASERNIKFKNLASRGYTSFIKLDSFEEIMDKIKQAYFAGKYVDKNIYLNALSKAKEIKDIEYIKHEIHFRFYNDFLDIKNNEDIMNIILINNDLNEILKYKKKFEDNGNVLDRRCYNELLYKCKNYEEAEILFKEKLEKGYDIDYSNYLNLIGLSKDFNQAYKLKEEMKYCGLECDIKIYQKLINKCNSGKIAIDILEEMKKLNIFIDKKILNTAIAKADNIEQVHKIKMFFSEIF